MASFRKRPLRHQIHRKLPGEHQTLRLRIGADVGYLARATQPAVMSLPMPTPGRAVSFAITVSPRAQRAMSASVTRCGEPTPMKPPIITIASSGTSAAAPQIDSEPHVAHAQQVCNVVTPGRYFIGRYRSTKISRSHGLRSFAFAFQSLPANRHPGARPRIALIHAAVSRRAPGSTPVSQPSPSRR